MTHDDARETAEIMLEVREEKLAQQPDYVLHRSYLQYVLADEGELEDLFELS